MNTPLDEAWAAGLFEGEGCITCQPGRPHEIRLQLGSSDRDVVERFSKIMGHGTINVRTTSTGVAIRAANPKPLWIWACAGPAAATVLRRLLPYLGNRRSARARESLATREAHIAEATRARKCPHCGEMFCPRWGQAASRTQYCSTNCQKDASRAREKLKRRLDPRTCILCGAVYKPRRKDRKYCSYQCANRAWRITNRGAKLREHERL